MTFLNSVITDVTLGVGIIALVPAAESEYYLHHDNILISADDTCPSVPGSPVFSSPGPVSSRSEHSDYNSGSGVMLLSFSE